MDKATMKDMLRHAPEGSKGPGERLTDLEAIHAPDGPCAQHLIDFEKRLVALEIKMVLIAGLGGFLGALLGMFLLKLIGTK
jgi:hypothetical protein